MKYFVAADRVDESMGGKACGLARLMSLGANVPEFVVLPYNVFDISADLTDEKESVSYSERIENFKFPAEFLAEIKTVLDRMGVKNAAVRSSCSDEDGEEKSFAGQYKTELNVTANNICAAIKKVWLSAATRYGKKSYARQKRVRMSVIVQRQIASEISGVCFSSSPLDGNKILIEYVDGQCEKLVGGSTTPTRYEEDKYRAAEGFLEEIRKTALNIEKSLGHSADLEWCISDKKLYFVQLRKATATYDLPSISEGKWNLYVKREFPWLMHSVQIDASKIEVQKRFYNISIPIFDGALINGREYYSERNDRLTEKSWADIPMSALEEFCDSVQKNCERTSRYTARLARSNIESLKENVEKTVEEFFEEYLRSYVPMMMRPEEYLAKELQRRGVSHSDIDNLSYFTEYTMTVGEKIDFWTLAEKYHTRKDIDKDMTEYLSKYSWMKAPSSADGRQFTEDDVMHRILLADASECADKLKTIVESKKNMTKKLKDTFDALSSKTREIAELFNKFVYLRTRTAELSDRLFFVGQKTLLSKLTVGENKADYLYFGYKELLEFLETGKKPADLLARKRGNYTLWKEGEARTLFGEPPKELTAIEAMDNDLERQILKGSVACPGIVVGKVRKIGKPSDAAEMKNGEILVASMTTTDLTDAINMASGFVTDEGGISCHAAIIARELNVPCIVGTRKATQILKTGMTVKLDAYNGNVTILNTNEDIYKNKTKLEEICTFS